MLSKIKSQGADRLPEVTISIASKRLAQAGYYSILDQYESLSLFSLIAVNETIRTVD